MNLAQLYSITSGQKINKPVLYDTVFPLPFSEPYITFSPNSKPAKTYQLWEEVLILLEPILQKAGIKIVQLGAKDEMPYPACHHTMGQTTLNNTFYLVKNSLLHFGADSFVAHTAGVYDKPMVILYSNNFVNNVCPYFGSREKQRFLEPPARKEGVNPSFSLDEAPFRQIDNISFIDIARNVCELLGLEFDFPYELVHMGPLYRHKLLDAVPNQVVTVQGLGVNNLIMRMDINFNENFLQQQVKVCPVSIVTDRPININLLSQIKPRILDLHYEIKEDDDPNFVRDVLDLGIKTNLSTYLSGEEIAKKKIDYLEYGPIFERDKRTLWEIEPDLELKPEELYYKSRRVTLSNRSHYPSVAAVKANIPNPKNDYSWQILPLAPLNNEEFWREREHFMYLKKKES